MSGADLVQADQYDYLPNYKWDESFRLEGFAEKVNSANEHMSLQARVALDTFLAEDCEFDPCQTKQPLEPSSDGVRDV